AGYLPPTNQVDSWLTVNADNTVVFKTSQIEIGNGVTTGLGQIVAEEVELAPSHGRHSAFDSWVVVNSGATGGRSGIQSRARPPAKQALLKLAAANLGVAQSSLTVKEGVVSGGGKTVTYGQLLGDKLFSTTLVAPTLNPGQSPSKAVADYKVIGTKVPRVDVPD